MNAPVESKLKCCPFCQGEALVIPTAMPKGGIRYRPTCTNAGCGASLSLYGGEAEAITAWNTRPQVAELVEALEVLLEKHLPHHNSIEHAAARRLIASHKGEQP